ncbi:S26 family signal peptidase [Terrimonas pollutisoli]|uniref:S26 family signal peptidase n=1 Tax=Terrimonas pollutisoli TaxID=3034147 RepID=UPI0023EC2220|nr:S26 family signal peptidase [Terrimonas sp. H1YJ31]
MPLQHLLIIYLIGTLLVFLPSFGLAKLFTKAGEQSWKAYVPFYNTWVMQDIAKRPKHWVFWQFIPVVGWFISPGIFIEFAKVFGKFSLGHHTMAALLAPFYFPWLANHKDTRFVGAEVARKQKKAVWREWVDAAIFAIVAATLIRTFIFEAYTIPSGSMEKTLLVRDFLFVSKLSYGPRIPNTPLSVPFVHNYLPVTNGKSYSEMIKLPYTRWFAAMPKRGDVVVFNFPAGDTVIHAEGFESAYPYYDIKRKAAAGSRDDQMILADPQNFPIVVHPVDKTDNYIKRCVGVAGDTLEVKENIVYINGVKQELPPHSEMYYLVTLNATSLDEDVMRDEYNLDIDKGDYGLTGRPGEYRMLLTAAAKEKMQKNGLIKTIVTDVNYPGSAGVFPYDTVASHNAWTRDNVGPIWIPKKGASLKLTPENYSIYERAIRVYERNDFVSRDGKFFLNGKEVTDYTFKMDYFWMMGDNRQGSQDSRYWGFVPEDRIVGKAWMIWFSWEGGPRWSRFFNIVK